MEFYFILFLLLIGLVIGFLFWVYRIYKLAVNGKRKAFLINTALLTVLSVFITWHLQVFPLSMNFYIKQLTTELTGRTFWSWKEYAYDEWGVRGEGYTLYIYKFNEVTAQYFTNPDTSFFSDFPPNDKSEIKWKPTPVNGSTAFDALTFATPTYGGWEGEIVSRQDFIRQIASTEGSYYAYRHKSSTDFYLIAPKQRLIILINHNM
jgi:hypothetical protein